MLIAKWLACAKSAKLAACRDKLHSTRGGSSETEENELTVTPMRRPSFARVLTTVTPVANWPSARRKSRRSNRSAAALAASSRNAPAASASMNHGNSERGSSKPFTKAPDTSFSRAPDWRILDTCGGALSNMLVHSVTQRAYPDQ